MPALAVTDHNGLYGAVAFWRAARDEGLRPIIGAEVTLDDGRETDGHLTLLAETQAGYSNLCRLISRAQLAGEKGAPAFTWSLLETHAEGLICLSGCCEGAVVRAVRAKDYGRAVGVAERLRDVFGAESVFVELQRHLLPNEDRLTHLLARLANHVGVGVVATNNVHYATPAGRPLHDVLTCIRQRTTLELGRSLLWPNAERYLKSPARMAALFADLPETVANTARIAERCQVNLDLSAYRLPYLGGGAEGHGSTGARENSPPCGFYSDPIRECTCSMATITRYQKRISGPLLDRIDYCRTGGTTSKFPALNTTS